MNDFLDRRRARVAAALPLRDEIMLVGAGDPIPIPGGADQTFPFNSHAEYFYLAGHECAGGVLAFDPHEGWVDFVPDVTEAERVWEGRTDVTGVPLTTFPVWITARRGRRIAMLGVPLLGVHADPGLTEDVRIALLHARRPKDEVELGLLRQAAAATTAGYLVAAKMMREGVSEREVQIELEAEFFRHGGDGVGYGTIVAAGSNSAVLHFSPTTRRIRAGDPVLIDAGAHTGRYVCDVTRTYRAPGGDAGFFRDLYRVVLEVEERAIERCRAGAEWRDLHLTAALEIVAGLVGLGILRGEPASLVERDAHALFFPHGLGHMVGLGVRDAGGFLPGRARSTRPGLSNLRTDLPLEIGYTMTVEPGVYFIPALLDDQGRRERYRDAVNWKRVDELREFGGIRIEDNVVITDGAPEVLTAAIPKTLD